MVLDATKWAISYVNQLEQRDPALNTVVKAASTKILLTHPQLAGTLNDLTFTVEKGKIIDPLIFLSNNMNQDQWRTLVAELNQNHDPRGVFQTLRSVHIPEEAEVKTILAALKAAATVGTPSANTPKPVLKPVVAKPVVHQTVQTVSNNTVIKHYNWLTIIGAGLVLGGIGALCGYFLTKPIPDDDAG